MQTADLISTAGRARLVVFGACLAVFFTAFEVLTPLVDFGVFNLTTSKLAAVIFFITVIAWGAGDWRRLFTRRSLDLAVLLFIGSDLLSVATAANKVEAFKFTLRMVYAAGIYFGVSRLPRRLRSHLAVAGTITVAVLIVSVMGLLENFVIPVTWTWLLKPFQEEVTTFGAFYNIRVASTLPFPTSLSMYLELAMPVALAFGLWLAGRARTPLRRWYWLGATAAGATAIMATQLYTFTRSGMVAAPLSLLAGAVLAAIFGYGRRVWIMLSLAAVMFVVVLGGSALFSDKMAVRLGLRQQENHYGAVYTLEDFPQSLGLGQRYQARLQIRNTGAITWGTKGSDDEVSVVYRWLSYPDGKEQDVPFEATYLPHAVPPGGIVDVTADFDTPPQPGQYVIAFDLSHLHKTWFSAAGVNALQVPVRFTGATGARFVSSAPAARFNLGEPEADFTSRSDLWRAAIKMWRDHPILGIGADGFRLSYPGYIHVTPDERIRTHDIFLEALANTGVIGLLAMLYLLGAAAWVQLKLVMDRSQGQGSRLLAIALIVGLIAYVGHGFLDYFLWQTGVSFLFFALLGLTAWLDEKRKEPAGS